MKITVVGAGRIGMHLAKYFVEENQDVFLVDADRTRLAELEMDYNLRTFCGNPTDFDVLREAGADRCDVFTAVTGNTAENLVACSVAKSMGARKTIARVEDAGYLKEDNRAVLSKMGVDHVVFPDFVAASAVCDALEHSWCTSWYEFNNGEIILIGVRVTDDSPLNGRQLKDLFTESRYFHISAMRRNHATLIPRGDDCILTGDTLYITTMHQWLDKVKLTTGIKDLGIKNVLIVGGSTVAELVTKNADDRFDFVIVEKNMARCRQLSETCGKCDVICGDASRFDVLAEAGIVKSQAFVALMDNTESNILSCLTARDAGVARTVAEVEKEQLIEKAEAFNIDSIINKPVITANSIFQLILDADYNTSKCFVMNDAEVARLSVKPSSYLTSAPVKDLKLPRDLTLAGMIRGGRGMLVTGNTVLESGDSVIVFCLKGSLDKVEKLFRK